MAEARRINLGKIMSALHNPVIEEPDYSRAPSDPNVFADAWATQTPGTLAMYAIVHGAKEAPTKYIVRRWEIEAGKRFVLEGRAFDSIEEARSSIPEGLISLPRDVADDPVIVETWI